jgi:hypothetical protein
MKGQKEAVIECVKQLLPLFNPYKDIALIMLSKDQLESLKEQIGIGIYRQLIEYSKDHTNGAEVTAYARAMVMNHLKKAKELNGNQVYGSTPAMVQSRNEEKKLATINMDALPDDLKAYVKTLV